VLSGFFEPVFFLLSLGFGLGNLIGGVSTSSGQHIPYAAFIAPALLAVSAMNGAIYDSTWNVFFKMQYAKLYEGMLATSLGPLDVALGEIALALFRGLLYAVSFMIVMQALGLNLAWTAVLALPAVLLIAFGFASLGMAITSYMKTFQQMDWINFVLMPMFMFSATFYPISVYPQWLQWVVEALPLWHGVELVRGLTTGDLSFDMLWHVLYYLVMIGIGLVFTTKRLRALFLD
jgi:lipooligosaccharide transport system permease protein